MTMNRKFLLWPVLYTRIKIDALKSISSFFTCSECEVYDTLRSSASCFTTRGIILSCPQVFHGLIFSNYTKQTGDN